MWLGLRAFAPAVAVSAAGVVGPTRQHDVSARSAPARASAPPSERPLLSGSVTDTHTDAIAGADLSIVLVTDTDADADAPIAVRSADDGSFSVELPRPGTARVSVQAAGFMPAQEEVAVERAGAVLELDLAAYGQLTGRVEGAAEPRAGLQVLAESLTEPERVMSAEVDETRRFEFPRVEPGAYQLRLVRGREALPAQRTVVVAPRARLDVVLVAPGAGTLLVTVRLPAAVALPVRADVVLAALNSNALQRFPGVLGPDALLRVPGLAPGDYEVGLEVAGVGAPAPQQVAIAADVETTLRFEWPRGIVEGAVRGPGGASPGARVVLYPLAARTGANGPARDSVDSAAARAAVGDARGAFAFHGVAAGRYLLSAHASDGARASTNVTLTEGATASLDLMLEAGRPLLVHAVQASHPVAGVDVYAVREPHAESSWSGRTDEQGIARLGPVPAGSYQVVALTASERHRSEARGRVVVPAPSGISPVEVELALPEVTRQPAQAQQ